MANEQKMSRMALTAMVVGGMVGAGIFSLPRTFANATGPLGAVIAWLIAGTGMYMLARVFQALAERKPDLDAGVFAYAKAGFGDYPGHLSAFGYWIGSCIGNVSYWVLIKSTLGAFFPVFGDGNTVVGHRRRLGRHLAVPLPDPARRAAGGVHQQHRHGGQGHPDPGVHRDPAVFAFKMDLFRFNLYGGDLTTGLFEQVKATMLVTVFVFIGIEGASVYSRYAKERTDVGWATIVGFIGVTGLMVLVTLLPYAVLQRADIAGMRQPSMAGVLESVVGPWGAVFVSVGLLVSVLGAYLAWALICAEVMFAAGKSKDMPQGLREDERERRAGGGDVVDQHHHPDHRHHDLLVARRVLADAQPDQRDHADPVLLRRRLRPDDRASAARPTSCGPRSGSATWSWPASRWSTRCS